MISDTGVLRYPCLLRRSAVRTTIRFLVSSPLVIIRLQSKRPIGLLNTGGANGTQPCGRVRTRHERSPEPRILLITRAFWRRPHLSVSGEIGGICMGAAPSLFVEGAVIADDPCLTHHRQLDAARLDAALERAERLELGDRLAAVLDR